MTYVEEELVGNLVEVFVDKNAGTSVALVPGVHYRLDHESYG